jgi:hypothetical protein
MEVLTLKRTLRTITLIASLVVIVSLLFVPLGCGNTGKTNTNNKNYTDVAGRKGDIITGAKVEAVTTAVAATGGTVQVTSPGSPLDGFVIDVPANAYSASKDFKISYAPITSQTFGSAVTPISPMIYVDNGGAYADELLYVRVPVTVPEGYFAMGFIYDEQSKTLEGMPLIAADAKSVTVATRHFSEFIISMISKALLLADIDSGFKPGLDDWQFTNYGSFIASGGHCEGQSLTALWYYVTRPDGNNTHLFGIYDNNGDKPATPSFWNDDSRGYRFSSVVQTEIDSLSLANKFWLNMGGKNWILEDNKWKMVDVPLGMGDEVTRALFAYAIQVTGEPQLVIIWSSAGGGHAMICYRVSKDSLYIADPNYPGNTGRRIEYSDGKLSPYNSGANKDEIDAGRGKAYETIQYYAKSTVVPWSSIAAHWGELKAGTVGNNKFPGFQLKYVDDKGQDQPLPDGLKTPFDAISIGVDSFSQAQLAIYVYRDGAALQYDAKSNFDLEPGLNKLGIYIVGEVNDKWKYVDFKYINVTYEEETTTTKVRGEHPVIASISGPTSLAEFTVGGSVSYSLNIEGGTPPYTVTWTSDHGTLASGKDAESVTLEVNKLRWNGEGYWVYITVMDAAGEAAAWVDSVGMGQQEFVYGVTSQGIVTQPSFPYKSFGSQ